MDTTRIPPQAVDVEQKVLGAMFQSASALGVCMELLKVEDFYRQVHSEIFQAMSDLFNRSEPVDVVMVANELKRNKKLDLVGGEVYLMELVECAVTPSNVEYHGGIVKEKAVLRELINAASQIVTRAFEAEEDVSTILDESAARIFDVTQGKTRQVFDKIGDLLPHTFNEIDKYGKGEFLGTPTGFKELDDQLAGLQSGDLIILAGRPAMGKTAFALSLAANAAILAGKAVCIFSLEMSKQSLVQRMLCAQAKVNMHLLRTGRLPTRDFPKLSLGAGPLYEARIFIDDNSETSVLEMRAKARRMKAQGNLDLLIVDYLQLVSPGKKLQSRENEISYISRSLKGLAKDVGVPVVALSQLSRRAEDRTDARPQLSDLRESGAIEQDADVVLFVYREEVYKEGAEPGKAEIIIGKQRNGPIGSAAVTFVKDYASFENYSPRAEEPTF